MSLIRSVLYHVPLSYNISTMFPNTLQNLLDFFLKLLSLRFSGLHENFVQAILSKEPCFCVGLKHPTINDGGGRDFNFLFIIY